MLFQKCMWIEGWGNIQLGPCQIFIDEQDVKEVIAGDYAIHCSFEFLVERANNKIYTVSCSDGHFVWKFHASKLPDGTT